MPARGCDPGGGCGEGAAVVGKVWVAGMGQGGRRAGAGSEESWQQQGESPLTDWCAAGWRASCINEVLKLVISQGYILLCLCFGDVCRSARRQESTVAACFWTKPTTDHSNYFVPLSVTRLGGIVYANCGEA